MARARAKSSNGMDSVLQERNDYLMANRRNAQSRRRKGVPSQGAPADYHYRNQGDWLWMSELAWDMYRNNMILGSITDRAVENQLQGGFAYDPQTGDAKLDQQLKEWWAEVSIDPRQCDPGADLAFRDQEEIALRASLVSGDIVGVPLEDGTVDLIEGQQIRSPSRPTKEAIVHGFEYVPGTRRLAAIWVLKDDVNPNSRQIRKQDLRPIQAWDDDGEKSIFHVAFKKRTRQTRGITAYAPLFDVAGYNDDVQFLKMVQSRAASMFVFVRKRATNFDPAYLAAETNLGKDISSDRDSEYATNNRQYREVAAGSSIEGLPGEEIQPWASNIPNSEFFEHTKLLLTFIGVNLGMPLVLSLMDASETNFSGYRGAVDQARQGFRTNQKRFREKFHRPYMRFKLFKLGEEDRSIAKRIDQIVNRSPSASKPKINIFKHRWIPPDWPYIEPTKDATADLIRDANMLTSPRRRCQERSCDWDDIFTETVDDRFKALDYSLQQSQVLKEKYNLDTDLHTLAMILAPMPTAERTNVSVQSSAAETQEPENKNEQ